MNSIVQIFFCLLFVSSFGQQKKIRNQFNQKKEQIKFLKIVFIKEELKLTPTENEKFWPLYNDFEDKQNELRKERMKGYLNKIDKVETLNEKEADIIISKMEELERELLESKKKFTSNLKTFLSSVKILKLKKAEEDFNKKLLRQYKENKK